MHRYKFERTVVLRQEIRETLKVEAKSEAEARAIATKQDAEVDHKQIEFETIEDEGALELISTEELELNEFE